jgi:arylsulfatase A-like enzyme
VRPEPAPDRPNILLIIIESLRADHVGCYGYSRDTTPNLDALARQSTLFEQAHAVTSWTLTSHASIFTGLYPTAHQVTLPRDRLNDGYETAAEILSADGYQCAAVVGGPYLREPYNLCQGFEYYDQTVSAVTDAEAHEDVTNPRMAEAMDRFLLQKRDPQRPFFLFAYYWDVHYTYNPPPPYDAMFVPPNAEKIEQFPIIFAPVMELGKQISAANLAYLVSQYDGEIRCTDDYLGKLWARLRELGLWDRTAIIVTADHGEEFFDHGRPAHKNSLYVESLHVPLLIKWPGQPRPTRDARNVSLVDLFPTILELAGGHASQPHSGESLREPSPATERRTYFELKTTWSIKNRQTGSTWTEQNDWVATREGRYKLIGVRNLERWELYDVINDPREIHPLGADHKETAAALRAHLESWQRSMQELSRLWERGPQAQLSPEEEARLRSLGYIQ